MAKETAGNVNLPVGLLVVASDVSDVTGVEVADEIVIDPFATVVTVVPLVVDVLISTAGSLVFWPLNFCVSSCFVAFLSSFAMFDELFVRIVVGVALYESEVIAANGFGGG